MRNILVHEYFGLNLRQVWMVVVRDLPELRSKVEPVLVEVREQPGSSSL